MKIGVLVPSEEYRNYAGARIRYGRIAECLAACGHSLALENISSFDPLSSQHDVLLVSKCYDARALVAARLFSDRGGLVGVDLFDDYFSQTFDARLMRFRNWLQQMAAMADFALCSTEPLAAIARTYRADWPTHVMNDPAIELEAEDLATSIAMRCAEARQQKLLRLCWFGVGDNPYFPVGLHDLAIFGPELRRLTSAGYFVELTVLTNSRSLDANRLALLRGLPILTRIEEWSEAREAELLRSSIAAFIPVNAQGFSTAKSLNRAVSALNAGCQVISAGYPLYAAFDQMIYRDPAELAADLARGELRLSAATLQASQALLQAFASAGREAEGLAEFLAGLDRRTQPPRPLPIALVHGFATSGEAHKMVKAAGGLSIGSPFCKTRLGFDATFAQSRDGGGIDVVVPEKQRKRLRPEAIGRARNDGGKGCVTIVSGLGISSSTIALPEPDATLALQLASYRACMEQVAGQVAEAFGPCHVIFSDNSALPLAFPALTGASQ